MITDYIYLYMLELPLQTNLKHLRIFFFNIERISHLLQMESDRTR
jgi:hypothetical protein